MPEWYCAVLGTTSVYYRDPDDNQVKMENDNFATTVEGKEYMRSPTLANNPIGVEFDPDGLTALFRSGTSVRELVHID